MPARNVYHDAVKNALIKDGWTITHDPYKLKWGGKNLYVDLGAERLLGAAKAEQRVAVEVQSFLGESEVEDLEKAVGQYSVYRLILARQEPDRTLYLAVPNRVIVNVFEEPIGELVLQNDLVLVIGFDPPNRGDRPMDALETYRAAIESILREYAEIPYAVGNLHNETVFDRANDRYLLVTRGWEGDKRVHHVLIHINIIDGKLWIHCDGTEHGVAKELVAKGIPKDHIVLAFHPQSERQHTGYAVA